MNAKQAVKSIREKDAELSLLREGWMNAKNISKVRYMRMINKHLDERLILMKTRDGNEVTDGGN